MRIHERTARHIIEVFKDYKENIKDAQRCYGGQPIYEERGKDFDINNDNYQTLINLLSDLNSECIGDLRALMWIGRECIENPDTLLGMETHIDASKDSNITDVSYLLGTINLDQYLEKGLEQIKGSAFEKNTSDLG